MAKVPHRFLPDDDLSETQIYVTMQTFDRFAGEYAERWEWNTKTIKEIKKYNIAPFKKFAKRRGTVLIVDCRSGRDYSLLTKEGFTCLGVGLSYGLLTEAVRRVPGGLFVHLDLRLLPFLPESFDAVYADALTTVPKRDMGDTLRDFRIFLKPGGVIYLSLKLGDANILVMEDLGGKRYLTLFQKQEILDLIEGAGFKMVWSKVSPHTDPRLPKWFSLVAEK